MSTARTDEFMRTLPPGPLIQHIGQVHVILTNYTIGGQYPHVIDAAEHSLREIARYTQADEHRRYYESAEYHAEKQRERMATFTPPNLAGLGEAMRAGIKSMADTVAKMRGRNELSGLNERTREREYKARIARERAMGLAAVQEQARQARQALRAEIRINIPENRSK